MYSHDHIFVMIWLVFFFLCNLHVQSRTVLKSHWLPNLGKSKHRSESFWVSCIDTQGLLVVFRLYISFPHPHLHSNLRFCSEIIVLRLALINLTSYNSDWVNGLFLGVTNSATFGGPSKIPGRPPRLRAGVQDRPQVGENPRQTS